MCLISINNEGMSFTHQKKPPASSKIHVDFYVDPCRSNLKYREISRNKLDEMQIA